MVASSNVLAVELYRGHRWLGTGRSRMTRVSQHSHAPAFILHDKLDRYGSATVVFTFDDDGHFGLLSQRIPLVVGA